jgi:hypothetical protein
MPIESSVTYISDLNAAYPALGDDLEKGDDHLRNIKTALLNSVPGITGAVTSTHTELNLVDGSVAATVVASKAVIYGANGQVIGTSFGAAEYNAGSSGTSLTINFQNGVNQKITLTGACTFTFSNPVAGMTAKLKLIQDGTGSRTVTWPTIKWAGGAAPTLTTTATTGTDIISLYYDGSAYWGMAGIGFA